MGLIAIVALFFYAWALKSGYKTEYLKEAINVNNEMKAAEAQTASAKEQIIEKQIK
jgi:hypothetical protein